VQIYIKYPYTDKNKEDKQKKDSIFSNFILTKIINFAGENFSLKIYGINTAIENS